MSDAHAPSPWIVEAGEATFQQEVVERSRQMLVVVDFWAEWCQPCRLLAPILEKVAREYDGKFLLVKADTEKLPNIAAGFGVQSIPAVYALRDGNLADFFVGLRDELQLRQWIDRLLPSKAETLVAEARLAMQDRPDEAEAKLGEARQLEPNLASATIALAQLYLQQGRIDDARALIETLEQRGYLEEEAERIKAQLHVQAARHSAAALDALQKQVESDPANLDARLELAAALAAANQPEAALQTALAVVETHKPAYVERARSLMVDLFRVLPDDSPLVTEYRRRLSTALY